jgi:hypothetical protein
MVWWKTTKLKESIMPMGIGTYNKVGRPAKKKKKKAKKKKKK